LTGNWKNNSIGNNIECPFGQGKVKAILTRKIEKTHTRAIKTRKNNWQLPKVYYFSIDFEANIVRNNFENILN